MNNGNTHVSLMANRTSHSTGMSDKFPELSDLQYYTLNRQQLFLLLYTFYCIIGIKINYIPNNRIQPHPEYQNCLE